MWNEKFATATAELRRFPRGALPQNIFRAAFWNCRMNGFGRRPQIPPTFEAAMQTALRVVRCHYPNFTPHISQ